MSNMGKSGFNGDTMRARDQVKLITKPIHREFRFVFSFFFLCKLSFARHIKYRVTWKVNNKDENETSFNIKYSLENPPILCPNFFRSSSAQSQTSPLQGPTSTCSLTCLFIKKQDTTPKIIPTYIIHFMQVTISYCWVIYTVYSNFPSSQMLPHFHPPLTHNISVIQYFLIFAPYSISPENIHALPATILKLPYERIFYWVERRMVVRDC